MDAFLLLDDHQVLVPNTDQDEDLMLEWSRATEQDDWEFKGRCQKLW